MLVLVLVFRLVLYALLVLLLLLRDVVAPLSRCCFLLLPVSFRLSVALAIT